MYIEFGCGEALEKTPIINGLIHQVTVVGLTFLCRDEGGGCIEMRGKVHRDEGGGCVGMRGRVHRDEGGGCIEMRGEGA